MTPSNARKHTAHSTVNAVKPDESSNVAEMANPNISTTDTVQINLYHTGLSCAGEDEERAAANEKK